MSERPPVITEEMLDRRVSLESGMSFLPPVTLTLMAANAAVFAAELSRGALASREALVAAGAKESAAVIGGQWWRLGSYMFLHGSFEHIGSNLIALYLMGLIAERAFGRRFTLLAYVATGLLAGLATCLRPGVCVGASGAIFGLFGLAASGLYGYRDRLGSQEKRIGGILLLWACYAVLEGVVRPQVDNVAHAAGLAAGLVLGRAVTPKLFVAAGESAFGPLHWAALACALAALAYSGVGWAGSVGLAG